MTESSINSRTVSVIVSPTVLHNDIESHSKPRPIDYSLKSSKCTPQPTSTNNLFQDLSAKSFSNYIAAIQRNSSTSSMVVNAKDRLSRPSIGINGTEQGANRMSYPREFKLLVISYYFQHGQNKYRTCKEFQITKSMLNGWLQKVDKIQQSRPGSLKSGRSGRKPQFPTVEKQLYHVYQACLTAGKKVGNRWLRETAKLIAQEQCTPEELNGMCQFSERWLCNFKKRYNINLTKDWNGELNVKPSSDGLSCSPTPETCSSPTNCEADSSTSPKKCESPPPETTPSRTMDITTDDDDSDKNCSSLLPPQNFNKINIRKKSALHNSEADTSIYKVQPSSPVNSLAPMKTSIKIGFQPYEPGRRGRKVQFPQVEEILYKNLCGKQCDGVRVSNRWLQDEARRLAVELCPEMFTNAFKSARCMFSEHWLHNFKKRYGISLKQQQNSTANNSNLSVLDPLGAPNDDSISMSTKTERSTQPQMFNIWDIQNSIALEAAKNGLIISGADVSYQQRFGSNRGASASDVMADDLPTMVPLNTLSQSLTKINLAEWYSKISNANNVGECLQMLTDEVRMRKASSTIKVSSEMNQQTS